MLPDTGIDDVKKQRNAEYAKHINDPVLSSLKMEGVRLLFFPIKTLKPSLVSTTRARCPTQLKLVVRLSQ
jgi:hypothetical protein